MLGIRQKLLLGTLLTMSLVTVGCAHGGHPGDYRGSDHHRYADRSHGGPAGIRSAAHQLEYASEDFYQDLRYRIGKNHLTRDARKLARAARHFNRQIEYGSSLRHLRKDYAKLAQRYDRLQRELLATERYGHRGYRGDVFRRGDFREVRLAFNRLQDAVNQARYRHHSRYFDRDHPRPFRRHDSGASIRIGTRLD